MQCWISAGTTGGRWPWAGIRPVSYTHLYLALEPVAENPEGEYVILKMEKDGEEDILVTIDDDDEFDRVADYFEDELFSEISYDDMDADEDSVKEEE